MSDDLAKFDLAFEQSTLKISDILRTLLRNAQTDLNSQLTVNEKSVDQYIKTFEWNTTKYRIDKSLQEITELLNQEVTSIDTLMKHKMSNYTQVKGSLQNLQRKETGNLAVKNLVGIVKKEHFVLDSEYLETILVAVPRNLYKDWLNNYETLTQMVVPRSSQKVVEDDEYGVFTVTLFKRIVEDFSHRCREEKFVVRDFKYDEAALTNQKKDLEEITATEKEQQTTLLQLAKTNFGEIFASWIHLKALRIFVESVLRYGLPPDFAAMAVKPKHKMDRKAREVLNTQYGHLGGIHGQQVQSKSGDADEALEQQYQSLFDNDYHPYVFFDVRWDPER
ncbi:ATPase, V1 complex, subunit C, partial [Jimgerdemannia flammicorona]